MSLCLRSIPNKFASLVNKHRQVIQFNHQSSKQSPLFLNEFLDMQTKIKIKNVAINSTKCSVNSLICLLGQNIPNTFYNAHIESSNTYKKKYNCNKYQTSAVHKWKELNIQPLSVINSDHSGVYKLKNNVQLLESCMDFKTNECGLSKITLTKRISDNTLFSSKMKSILYSEASPNVQDIDKKEYKLPEERLQPAFKQLQIDLPLLFVGHMDYSIYTQDLIFINNIKGTSFTGIQQYKYQIALLKIISHIRFAYIKCNILKITMHPEDSTIKVRWRIEGVSGTNIFLSFWKINVFNLRESIQNKAKWYDGFSIFYVNNDGKIFKHVVDKLMPDQDQQKVKTPVEPKLALFVALLSLDSYYFDKLYLETYSQLLQIKQKNEQ